MPDLAMLEPSSEPGVAAAVRWAVREAKGPVYIRLVSVPWELPYDQPDPAGIEPGRGWALRDGRDVVLVGAGPVVLSGAYRAAEELAAEGLEVGVLELPWLRGVDGHWLAGQTGRSLTLFLDNHYVTGGHGEACLSALAAAGATTGRLALHGVEEIPVCGTNEEVLAHHRLDGAGIAARVREELA
jgi:transketolase